MKNIILLLTSVLSLSSWAQSRLEIIQIGHPTLREIARELTVEEIRSPEIQTLIDDMVFTMKRASGVGLAAPQVNQSLRLFVMKSGLSVPLTVVINPKIEYLEEAGTQNSTEGCLSIPGQTVRVKRFKKLRMSYLNRHGEEMFEEVRGFKAIISQHEYDHLNGVLITDIMEQINGSWDLADYATAPLM
jgi:peptide deformylase